MTPTVFANHESQNPSRANFFNCEREDEVPDAGDPPSGPIRCKAYLKIIAAVIIRIVAGIVLGIPVAAICLPGLPFALCVLVEQRKDVSSNVKDIATLGTYIFMLPALPFIGLACYKVLDKTMFLIKDYPKQLWGEANKDLAQAHAIDKRAAFQSMIEWGKANEKKFIQSQLEVNQHEQDEKF